MPSYIIAAEKNSVAGGRASDASIEESRRFVMVVQKKANPKEPSLLCSDFTAACVSARVPLLSHARNSDRVQGLQGARRHLEQSVGGHEAF